MSTVTSSRQTGQRLALATLCAAQFMIALDYSIIYVALPTIATDLELTPATAQWVVSGYSIFFAGLLLVGGRLADRFGAGATFVASASLFGVASLVGGLADDGGLVLAARAAQGVAAAVLQPSVLGLLSARFTGDARAGAVAMWGAVGASGLAVGVVLGGVLTGLGWQWTFLVNVPIAAVAVAGALAAFRGAGDRSSTTPVPVVGAVTATVALLASVFALTLVADQAQQRTGLLVAGVVVAVVSGAAFLRHERSATPLIEHALRRPRTIRLGAVATALYMGSVGSEFYLVTLLLQQEHDYRPLAAGLGFLPLAALVTVGNIVAGRLIPRWTSPRVLLLGFVLSAVGLALLAATGVGHGYSTGVLPGLLISGFGHGIVYTSMFSLGTSDVPPGLEGGAGAILTTSQYLSAAVTVALLTIVLAVSPPSLRFAAAFAVTTLFAVAGAALAARARTVVPVGTGATR